MDPLGEIASYENRPFSSITFRTRNVSVETTAKRVLPALRSRDGSTSVAPSVDTPPAVPSNATRAMPYRPGTTRERTILRPGRVIARTTVPPPRAPIATYLIAPDGATTPWGPLLTPGAGPLADAAPVASAAATVVRTRILVRMEAPFTEVSGPGRETSRAAQPVTANVRVSTVPSRPAASAPHEHEPVAVEPQPHVDAAPDLPREVDAARGAVTRVEGVD